MINLSKVAVIIQGPIHNVERHMKVWEDFYPIISTWPITEYIANIPLFQSVRPKDTGVGNINLQKITTMGGLSVAHEFGFEYCIKIRSDLFPTNAKALVESLDPEKLNFIAKHRDKIDGYDGYLVDYFQFGKTSDLIKLWDIKNVYSNSTAETVLMNNFHKNFKPEDASFFLDSLGWYNDLWWDRSDISISSYKKDPAYRTRW